MQRSPLVRILRTVVEVLVALAAIVPAFVALLGAFGVHVDGAGIVAITSSAVIVLTAVAATFEQAGTAPVIRTALQAVIAVVAVVPAVVAALAQGGIHVDTAQLAAITGAAVLFVTTVQNLLEHKGAIPTLLANHPTCIGCGPVAAHGENHELIDNGEVR